MSKSAVLTAAKTQQSSIDPSESNSQLQVLLSKLEQGLGSNNNLIFRDVSSESIYLRTCVRLPKPLSPLLWTFELAPQDAVELGEELLRPCLFEASLSKQKLNSLHQVIKDKDHVISRLLEKLEGSNTDLGLIFPGVKSRKGRVTVAEAEKHIPGMAKFDLHAWSSHFENDSPYASYEFKGFEQLVAGCQQCPKHTARQHSDWLKHLQNRDQEDLQSMSPEPDATIDNKVPETVHGDESTASEDEFERQATPPHLQARNNIQEPKVDEKTTGETLRQDKWETDADQSKHMPTRQSAVTTQNSTTRNSPRRDRDRSKMGEVLNKADSSKRAETSDSETASEDDDLDAGGVDQGSRPERSNAADRNPKPQPYSEDERNYTEKEGKKSGKVKRGLQQKPSNLPKSRTSEDRATSSELSIHSRTKSASPSPMASTNASPDSEQNRGKRRETPSSPDMKVANNPSRKLGRIGKKKNDPPQAEGNSATEITPTRRKARDFTTHENETAELGDSEASDSSSARSKKKKNNKSNSISSSNSSNNGHNDRSSLSNQRNTRHNDTKITSTSINIKTATKDNPQHSTARSERHTCASPEIKSEMNGEPPTMTTTKMGSKMETNPETMEEENRKKEEEEVEPVEPLTMEEKANQRRQELKRTFDPSRSTVNSTSLGMRKKRKF